MAEDIYGHDWEKQNIITIEHHGRLYDELKCRRCGATAKRHGISWPPTLDKKYQDKTCQEVSAQMRKGEVWIEVHKIDDDVAVQVTLDSELSNPELKAAIQALKEKLRYYRSLRKQRKGTKTST